MPWASAADRLVAGAHGSMVAAANPWKGTASNASHRISDRNRVCICGDSSTVPCSKTQDTYPKVLLN
jgi:hypothetical protein